MMTILSLTVLPTKSFAQVYQFENPGFEEWDGNSSDDEPTGWNSFPSADCQLTGFAALGCGTATATRHQKSTDVRPGTTGTYSCKIYSTSALGIVANGALTSGRMELASTTANNVNNGNKTFISNDDFNHRLNAKPDSIVFWAKAVNASNTSQSCCHLYIHDNYNLKDPLGGNEDGYESHIVGKVPAYNFTNNGSTWQRHSTPILYDDCPSNNPQFILITFSTNATPGGGSSGDALYIDDIELIYNANLSEIAVNGNAIENFDQNTTEYYVEVPCGRTNYISATTASPRASYSTALSDDGLTATITVNHGDKQKIYTVHYVLVDITNEITETACDSYTWNTETYTTSGDYTQTFTIATDCDSIVTLHLTINNSVTHEITENACDSYTWNEETYTESGDYEKTFTADNACDSVVTLHLTINNSVTHEITEIACDSFTWNTETYTETGDYTQTFTAENTCDSVVTLHLTINNSVSPIFDITACDSYTWNNETYNESGQYTQEFTTVNGCDSIVTINLTINESPTREITATACGIFTYEGESYVESGNYTQVVPANEGCDSIITLHLTITESPNSEVSETACDNYTWFGQTYTESGDYYHIININEECDSLITLHLTINESVEYEFSENACNSFTWNNETYTESGDYIQEFETIHGCDSVVTLHLTINNSVTNEITETACESFAWNSETYAESGDYIQEFETIHGCDSVLTLHLTINNSVTNEISEIACDSFTWNNETYTESGNYVQEFETINGCDSVVTLHLTINETPIVSISGESEITIGDTITLLASGAETYYWSTGETTESIEVFPTETTTYTVIGYNGDCASEEESITVTVNSNVIINEIEILSVHLYPNPANDFTTFAISGYDGKLSYSIIDISGKEISTETVFVGGEILQTINVSNLVPGMYLLRLAANNTNYNLKFTKE